MMMVIRYFDGRLEEVVLLGATGNALRVMAPDGDDAVEFSLHEGMWLSEANEPVEIEFIANAAEGEWERFVERAEALERLSSVCGSGTGFESWRNSEVFDSGVPSSGSN